MLCLNAPPSKSETHLLSRSIPFALSSCLLFLPHPKLMSDGDVVFISGATGIFAAAINGAYDRASEICGGFSLYVKRGDSSMCIEHFEGRVLWQVKRVSVKGKSNSYAYVDGGCPLEACTSRAWKVAFDNLVHSDAPDVKMVTGVEANREVRGCCQQPPSHCVCHSSV